MRVGMSHLEWNVNEEPGPAPRSRGYLQRPAEARDALADAVEAQPAPAPAGERLVRVEATAVVTDLEQHLALPALDLDHGARGAGVARHVAEGLLGRAVERGLERGRQAAVDRAPHLDRD